MRRSRRALVRRARDGRSPTIRRGPAQRRAGVAGHAWRSTCVRVASPRSGCSCSTSDGLGEGANIAFDETMFTASAAGFSDWRQPCVRRVVRVVGHADDRARLRPGRTRTSAVRKRQPVIGYDPDCFVQSREWVQSRDGVDIPLSLVHHRDVSASRRFAAAALRLRLVRAQLRPADADLDPVTPRAGHGVRRGARTRRRRDGTQLVRARQAARRRRTPSTTSSTAPDISSSTGWTSPERMVAHGGSAGGLLMGAVANQAPELFAGVVAHVPFVDALTTILDPELPLTVIEWDEWGDPLHDPEVYAYMKSYTPYENIGATRYPGDLRVDVDQRHPRLLRRAREVDRPAARNGHAWTPDPLQVRDVRRPWRSQRSLRLLARDRPTTPHGSSTSPAPRTGPLHDDRRAAGATGARRT